MNIDIIFNGTVIESITHCNSLEDAYKYTCNRYSHSDLITVENIDTKDVYPKGNK